eukprot:gene12606-8642_t
MRSGATVWLVVGGLVQKAVWSSDVCVVASLSLPGVLLKILSTTRFAIVHLCPVMCVSIWKVRKPTAAADVHKRKEVDEDFYFPLLAVQEGPPPPRPRLDGGGPSMLFAPWPRRSAAASSIFFLTTLRHHHPTIPVVIGCSSPVVLRPVTQPVTFSHAAPAFSSASPPDVSWEDKLLAALAPPRAGWTYRIADDPHLLWVPCLDRYRYPPYATPTSSSSRSTGEASTVRRLSRQAMERQRGVWYDTQHTDWMMEKANLLEWALNHYYHSSTAIGCKKEEERGGGELEPSYPLVAFMDADICFLGPLPEFHTPTSASAAPLVALSPHAIAAPDEALFGAFNGGYVAVSHPAPLHKWRRATQDPGNRFFDQSSLEAVWAWATAQAAHGSATAVRVPLQHNYGYWRLMQTHEKMIRDEAKKFSIRFPAPPPPPPSSPSLSATQADGSPPHTPPLGTATLQYMGAPLCSVHTHFFTPKENCLESLELSPSTSSCSSASSSGSAEGTAMGLFNRLLISWLTEACVQQGRQGSEAVGSSSPSVPPSVYQKVLGLLPKDKHQIPFCKYHFFEPLHSCENYFKGKQIQEKNKQAIQGEPNSPMLRHKFSSPVVASPTAVREGSASPAESPVASPVIDVPACFPQREAFYKRYPDPEALWAANPPTMDAAVPMPIDPEAGPTIACKQQQQQAEPLFPALLKKNDAVVAAAAPVAESAAAGPSSPLFPLFMEAAGLFSPTRRTREDDLSLHISNHVLASASSSAVQQHNSTSNWSLDQLLSAGTGSPVAAALDADAAAASHTSAGSATLGTPVAASSPVCTAPAVAVQQSLEAMEAAAGVAEVVTTTDGTPAAEATATGKTKTTNAVNRSISDLHKPTWLALIMMNQTIRVTIFHPLQLALARKRVMQEKPPSSFALMRAAIKGGVRKLPGGKTPIDFGPGGIRSLYRGYGAAALSGLVGSSVYLFTMETMKEKFTKAAEAALACSQSLKGSNGNEEMTEEEKAEEAFKGHRFACAAGAMCADALTISIVTPIAVIVGRQMTSGVGLAAKNPYRSISGTVKVLWSLHQPKAEERIRRIAIKQRNSAVGHGVMSATDAVKLKKKVSGAGVAAANATIAGSKLSGTTPAVGKAGTAAGGAASGASGSVNIYKVHPLRRGFWRTVYGLRGMYQGMSVALLRVPFAGVWWGTYTTAKEKLYSTCAPTLERWEDERNAAKRKKNGVSSSSSSGEGESMWQRNWLLSPRDNIALNALASAFSSCMTTMLVNPMSVMQIRLQAMPHHDPKSAAAASSSAGVGAGSAAAKKAAAASGNSAMHRLTRKRGGLISVASSIIRKEGFRGFFKGTSTNIGIAIMDGIVFSLLFEVTKMVSERGVLLPVAEEEQSKVAKEKMEEAATTPAFAFVQQQEGNQEVLATAM